jgi:uncharacterized protein YjiS (DUF1127 family)
MTSLTKRTFATLPQVFMGGVAAAVRTLAVWNARARQRQVLGKLDGHILRDIGIDRWSAMDESQRPFWKD